MDNKDVASSVSQTRTLMQELLRQIQDNSHSQAAVRTEMTQLRESVSMLSNIIRGGDGRNRSLLTEVELIKSRLDDMEGKFKGMSEVLSSKVDDVKSRIDAEDNRRRADETVRMTIQQKEQADQRLDRRQRLNTYSTIIIAFISLIGSVLALLLRPT